MHPPTADHCVEESANQKFLVHQKIRKYLRFFLLFTGLYFANEEGRLKRRKASICVAIFVFGITLYQTIWRWVHFLSSGANNLITAYVLVWLSKAVLAQFLLIRWQLNGNIRIILDKITNFQLAPANSILGRSRRIICICIFFYSLFTISSTISTILKLTDALHIGKFIDKQIFMLYGSEYLIFICFLVWFVGLFSMISVIILLNLSSFVVFADLKELNAETKRMMAKKRKGEKGEQIYGELAKMCTKLTGMIDRVGQIDRIFNGYLFIMVASNVPTTILVILRFIVTSKSTIPDKWVEMGFQLPDLMFCLFELVGLILMPAKLHEIIHLTPISFGVEIPHEPPSKMHRRICRFVKFLCHQASFGVTLLQIFTISKSTILTIFSLVFSYLMFVLRVFNPTSLSAEMEQKKIE